MPVLAVERSQELKRCTKCQRQKPADTRYFHAFTWQGVSFLRGACADCCNEERRLAYERLKDDPARATQLELWMMNRRDREKALRRQPERLRELELVANLPVIVVQPYVEELLRRHENLRALSQHAKVQERELRRILKSQKQQVGLRTCDLLSVIGDFTLDELAERAREWADLTGNEWPIGFHPRTHKFGERQAA